MPDLVECLSSASYPGVPIALTWGGERCAVETILDRWRAPGEIGFRARTTDGLVFELIYADLAEAWRVVPITPHPNPPRKGEETP